MLHTLWSVKGGSGVTVLGAVLATTLARRHGRAVLVDLVGDQPAALGLADPRGPGVRDWLASEQAAPAALEHLLVEVDRGLSLLPAGTAPTWPARRTAQLPPAVRALASEVVVDAGTLAPGDPDSAGVGTVLQAATALASDGRSLLVVGPCYLALRRYRQIRSRLPDELGPDGVVLVDDRDRVLGPVEVAHALGVPVVASVQRDPAIGRAVDGGTLARLARSVERSLCDVT